MLVKMLLICCLLIGLPCSLCGCNSFSCPLKSRLTAQVVKSESYVEIQTICIRTNSDDGCMEYRSSPITMYLLDFKHMNGRCQLKADHSYNMNETILLFVENIGYPNCSLPTTLIDNIIWVGMFFNIIAGILGFCLVYSLVTKKSN